MKGIFTASKGITLIEVVIGIVVLGIALSLLATVLAPQAIVQLEPMYQVRASELARSFTADILSRSFDENSDRTGGETYCGPVTGTEVSTGSCTAPASFGSETGETFNTFNDVDDYHDYCGAGNRLSGTTLVNLLGLVSGSAYEQYQIEVCVTAADTELIPEATSDDGTIAKRVDVTVYLPTGTPIVFTSYRSNY